MMTHKVFISVFVLAVIAPTVIQCISVIGPRVVRPFSPYRVAVAGGSRAYTLYVAVEGRSANGEQYSQGREVQVPEVASKLVDLEIDDPGPGRYELVARSTSGPQFSASAQLMYQPRTFCVFIQSDKRVYQPGDTINFRVIALNKYLLPLAGAVDVSVLDAGGSPVRQWASLNLDRGILSLDFLLADEPSLGEWTIQVEARGQTYSRRILVADYVRPKFQMDIQVPKEVLFSEGRFPVNISAKHFNGLPVQGELTLSAYAVYFSGLLQPVFSSPSRKVVDFNGQVNVMYDLKTDLNLAEDAVRPLVVEAVLEAKDTLIKQNVSTRILLLRTPYRLKISSPNYFKPMLPYNVQIEVVDPMGQIIKATGDVTVERLWDDGTPPNVTTLALNSGLATYTLIPDKGYANSTLNLVIKYKDVSERVINVRKSAPSGGQFLTIELLTRNTTVGDEMRARITATEPMDLLHYAVIARGDVLFIKTIEMIPSSRSAEVSVPVEWRMAPASVLLAWYPRIDAATTLIASAVYAPHHKLLQHQVSISVSGAKYRPGGSVEFRVTGEAGSHAALLAEDFDAVVANLAGPEGLGSGLTMRMVEREVESFSGLKHSLFNNEDHLPGMGLDLGGNTTRDVFNNVGVVILTDGFVTSAKPEGIEAEAPETGTRPPLAGPYAFSRLPPPPSPRYYLTVEPQSTWMLTNLSLGFDGSGVETRHSPSLGAKWSVGAFAVHPTLGLGLASPQDFTTSVPLSMTAELPATLQRGETLAAVIILKSTLTVDTTVEVTFHNSEQYFEFEPLENSVESSKTIETFRRSQVTVPARGTASTAFLVTVVRLGEVSIIAEAGGVGVSASLFRTIDVKDGHEEDLWSLTLLDARRGMARGNVSLEPQAGTRLGPVSLVAAGDLMAPALKAFRGLSEPAADPPYALRPMAIAAVLLDYLQATERDGEEEVALTREARAQAAAGYQRLMAYRRADGSFAPEADSEAEGDVWMTAMSARWLSRAARYVPVGEGAARSAAQWLVRAQLPEGAWPPPRPAARNDPRAQAQLPLTAHALLALQQLQGSDVLYKNAMNSALDYISRHLDPSLDAYSLAVAAAALAHARHPFAKQALEYVDKYVNTTATTVFWSRKLSGNEYRNPWLVANTLEATTTAFVLRAMIATQLLEEGVPVARYLLRTVQPHQLDPEVLDSLAQFSRTIKTSTKLRVSVNVTGSEEARQFNIDDDNALIIQTQLVRNGRMGSATTEGRGLAVVGLTAKGRTNVTAAWPRYTLDPRVDQVSTKDRLQLSICIGWVSLGSETESGLALLTVTLPSGYLADINTITELTSAAHVVSARVQRGGARVVAWVRTARAERCATLGAPRVLAVARARPGYATLLDLYDSSHRARVFFQPVASTVCDLCRGRVWDACARACGSASQQVSEGGKGGSAGGGGGGGAAPDSAVAHLLSTTVLLLTATMILLLLR